jgi:hypothetical protein
VTGGGSRFSFGTSINALKRMLSVAKDSRISPVPLGKAKFLDSPRCDDLDRLDRRRASVSGLRSVMSARSWFEWDGWPGSRVPPSYGHEDLLITAAPMARLDL